MNPLGMEVPDRLIEGSSLSATQVESMVAYKKVASHDITLREAAQARSSGSVTIGSFYHTVQQGKGKIKSSILTVTIALWLGFVKPEDLRRLLDQVGKGLPELEDDEKERVAAVIEALVSQIVM